MHALKSILVRIFRRRAETRWSGSLIPMKPIRFGPFDRLPANGYAIVVLYRDPEGKVVRDACWWMPDNRSHHAQPRFFMDQCLRALSAGLLERVHGPKP